MTDHRQIVPISRKYFSFLEKQEKVGELPCQNFPDAFFPDIGTRGYQDTTYAKNLCSTCPLLQECRTYAIEAKEPYGIWGGLTVEERRIHRTAERNATASLYPSNPQ
jgi:WhiB family redox-sensing transcriptional regulator